MPRRCRFASRCALLLLFLSAQLVLAQQPPRLPLRLKEKIRLSQRAPRAFTEPIKCDARGNIYFRGGFLNPHADPVNKFSSSGEQLAVFSLDSVPGFKRPHFRDFAVDPFGNVYLLAFTEKRELALVVFDDDGDYESTLILDVLFGASHFAVFRSGEFLISGYEIDENGYETGKPYTAILDRHGKQVKELTLGGDIWTKPKPRERGAEVQEEATEARAEVEESGPPALETDKFGLAIDLGTAVAGDDGYVYLMRATPDPQIYVLSPSGELVRRLVVPAPVEEAERGTIKVGGGRLVVEFTVRDSRGYTKEYIFTIINPDNGETLSHYVGSIDVAGPFACYTANGFTFIRGDKETGQLVIDRTYPY